MPMVCTLDSQTCRSMPPDHCWVRRRSSATRLTTLHALDAGARRRAYETVYRAGETRKLLEGCAAAVPAPEQLATLEQDVSKLAKVQAPFPWLHYDDAIKLIQQKGSETPWGSDFGGTDETVIAENYDRPVVVHRFPTAIKAFYMEPDPERPELSLSADILAPEGYGEIVGGGERMSSPERLLDRIHEHQLPEEAFRWYIDLRKYGSVPHAGFGMGIERVVTWFCGIDHLRETIAFPRMLYRIYP